MKRTCQAPDRIPLTSLCGNFSAIEIDWISSGRLLATHCNRVAVHGFGYVRLSSNCKSTPYVFTHFAKEFKKSFLMSGSMFGSSATARARKMRFSL
jgi:hypothetical protein